MHHATSVKKLLIIWSVSLLTLCSVGYFYYSHWQQRVKPSDNIPYILSNSALVVDMPAMGRLSKDFKKTTIGQSLAAFSLGSPLQETWQWVQEVTAQQDDIPLTIAVQGLHKEALGCVLYLDLRIPTVATLVEQITDPHNNPTYAAEDRHYAGHIITTIYGGDSKSPYRLYLLKLSHYAIISMSELLLEDIIRGMVSKQRDTFLSLQKTTCKYGSLFINFYELPALLRIVLKEDQYATWSGKLTAMLSQTQLEVKFTDHYVLLQGAANSTHPLFTDTHWLPKMPTAQSNSRALQAYIPTATAVLQHYVIQDPIQCAQAIAQHGATSLSPTPEKQEDSSFIEAELEPFSSLNRGIQQDIALCTLGTAAQQHVLLVAIRDAEEYLQMLQETIPLPSDPAHQLPHFSAVYTVAAASMSYWLPQMLFPDFSPKFLTTVDNYLVLTNSFEALQTVATAYTQGTTWAQKAYGAHQLLASIAGQATLHTFVDLKMAHQWLLQQLKPAWAIRFEKSIGAFLENGYAGIQMGTTVAPCGGYMQAFLAQLPKQEPVPPKPLQAPASETTHAANVFFKTEKPIQTKPIWVETHKSENALVLVQDISNRLYLIRPDGTLVWKKQVDGQLLPEVLLVDMYKNKKWQYLCATATSLYVIDYTGNAVDPFPKRILAKGHATGVNVIDYDRDKNYRILVTDATGNIYLKDAQYRPLPGWNPHALKTSFAATPLHVRVVKDYFIALQNVGMLHVMNRRGQSYPGFPINIGEAIHNPPIIQKGQQAANTHIILLSETGRLKTYTLQGTLQHTIQLPTRGPVDKFTLVPNTVDKEAYVILQQSIDTLLFLNAAGDVLFEKPCAADQTVLAQYYNHGSYPLYVITKAEQGKTYIYDQQGQLLHAPLPNSGHPVEVFWTVPGQQLTVYTSFGNQVCKYLVEIGSGNVLEEDLYE